MVRRAKNGLPSDFVAQPVKVPTGGPYGRAKKLEDAQRQIPLPGPPAPAPPADPIAAAQAWNPTQGATPFDAPTTRKWEPVTAGLNTGPGAGPEALGRLAPGSTTMVANTLQALAARTGDPDLAALAALAANQGV